MKLLRFGPKGNEKPGLLDASGMLRDLSGVLPDLTSAHLGRASLCLLYTSPSPRDRQKSRMPSSA